ncbi:MAG: RHS repeat-associated protein, partial [Pirellulaceae bacterium]
STNVYDLAGQPIAKVNALGATTTTSYDLAGRPIVSTNPLGFKTTSVFDDAGRQIATEDALGFRTTTTYDAANRTVAGTNPLDETTTTVYNLAGDKVAVENPLGEVSTTVFDVTGHAIATINPLGQIETTIYNIASQTIAKLNPLGDATTTVYDKAGRTIANVNPLGEITTTQYNRDGKSETSINPLGFVSTNSYDATGRQIASQNPLGQIATTVFDAAGQSIATIDALGRIVTSQYDAMGQTVAQTNARGVIATTGYDVVGREITQQGHRGFVTTSTYDAAGRRVSTTDALGYRSTSIFNAIGQQISSVDAIGHTSTNVYDAAGKNVVVENAAGGLATKTFDRTGREIALQNTGSFTTTKTYDVAGREISVTDPEGNRTTQVYDAAARVIRTINAEGHATESSFDAAGRQISVTDGRGFATTFVYDATGQTVELIDPLGNIATSSYDAAARNDLRITPRGDRITHSFDAVGNMTGRVYPNDNRQTFVYDAVNNRTQMADATGITTSIYNRDNSVQAVVQPSSKRVTYAYDPIGNRTSLRDIDGGRFTYTHDAVSQLVGIINPRNERTTLAYTPIGKVELKQLGNGTTVSHSYDAAKNLQLIENVKADGTAVNVMTYTYDGMGNRLTQVELDGGTTTWTYDRLYQLAHEERTGVVSYDTGYTYDSAGNRRLRTENASDPLPTFTSYFFDSANQIEKSVEDSFGTTTYTHDASGNRTRVETPSQLTDYQWDAENRMTVAQPIQGDIDFTYNADGQRVSRSTDVETKRFVYDFERLLQETDDEDTTQRVYTFADNEYGDLVSEYGDEDSNYFLYDAQWSTDALIDGDEFTTDSYKYRAFGLVEKQNGNSHSPMTFVGKQGYYREDELDLYMLGASNANQGGRYYDPILGRFVSKDPVGFQAGDLNLYRYVRNNPINAIDPSGQTETFFSFGGHVYSMVLKSVAECGCNAFQTFFGTDVCGAVNDFGADSSRLLSTGLDGAGKILNVLGLGVIQGVSTFCDSPNPGIMGNIASAADGAGNAGDICPSAMRRFKRAVIEMVGDTRVANATRIYDAVVGGQPANIVMPVLELVGLGPDGLLALAQEHVPGVTQFLSVVKFIRQAMESIQSAGGIGNWLTELGEQAMGEITGAFEYFTNPDTLWNLAVSAATAIIPPFVLKLIAGLAAKFLEPTAAIIGWVLTVVNGIIFLVQNAGQIAEVFGAGQRMLGTAMSAVRGETTDGENPVNLLGAILKNTIIRHLPKVLDGLVLVASSGAVSVIRTINNFFKRITDAVQAPIRRVLTAIGKILEKIFERLGFGEGSLSVESSTSTAVTASSGTTTEFKHGSGRKRSVETFLGSRTGPEASAARTSLTAVNDTTAELRSLLARNQGGNGGAARAPGAQGGNQGGRVPAGRIRTLSSELDVKVKDLANKLEALMCPIPARGSCFVAGTVVHATTGALPIERVCIGQWVVTHSRATETNTPRRERLRIVRCTSNNIEIALLRNDDWFADYGAHVGGSVCLDMQDMSAVGLAQVLAINECPEIEPAPGRLVTGTFKHTSGEVYDLKLESETNPLGVTATHPFWSVDRNAWVSAIDLRIGETLKTLAGTTVVESRSKREEPETVYNIEVEGDHVYRVGESGVLVHNNSLPGSDEAQRIGGGAASNLTLKPAEERLDPPGISVHIGGTPEDAAEAMRRVFGRRSTLGRLARVVGTAEIAAIRRAGFDVIPDPTRNFPNHGRLIHPCGVSGFTPENLAELSRVFTDTSGL